MPNYVVAVRPDEDLFVWWSDITESPYAIGSEDFVRAYMIQSGKEAEADPERFIRARQTGTSAQWPDAEAPAYGWDDNGFVVEQKGFLPRERLEVFARLRLKNDPTCYDLLEPFDG